MERALYHTYRPQRWEKLIGQEAVTLALQNQVEHGPLGHAFLFSGPRAVGKTSAARLLAKSANCENLKGSEPCNECPPCVAITEGSALDVVEIDAASNTGVDNVRENIIQNARVAPSTLKKKIFIIDEVHMLSTSAFNALLKTLEEPPAHALFILATTELHKVPATIVSRCQHFTFKRVPVEPMVQLLEEITNKEKKNVADGVLKRVAFASEGCVRDAESLLAQLFSLGEEVTEEQADLVLPRDMVDTHASLAQHLLEKQTSPALKIISGLVNDNVHLQDFGKGFVEFLRHLLIFRATDDIVALTEARIDATVQRRLLENVKAARLEDLAKLNGLFLSSVESMKFAAVPTLPLEIAVVQWTGGAGVQPAAQAPEPEASEPPTQEPPQQPPAPTQEPEAPQEEPPAPADPEELTYEEVPQTPAPETPEPAPTPAPKPTPAPTPTPAPEPPKEESTQEEEEEKSDAKPTAHAIGAASFTLPQLESKWEAILSEMKKENPSLTATLKVGKPIAVEAEVITVAFRFPFHKERMDDARNKQTVETIFASVLKTGVRIVCDVNTELELPSTNARAEEENIEPVSEEEMSNVWNLAVNTFADPNEAQEA